MNPLPLPVGPLPIEVGGCIVLAFLDLGGTGKVQDPDDPIAPSDVVGVFTLAGLDFGVMAAGGGATPCCPASVNTCDGPDGCGGAGVRRTVRGLWFSSVACPALSSSYSSSSMIHHHHHHHHLEVPVGLEVLH
eukprot:696977-Amphidinium_carterae.2